MRPGLVRFRAVIGGLVPGRRGGLLAEQSGRSTTHLAMTFSGHRARKRFGQHWLTDPAVLERIVAAAAIEPGEHLLEVGPGRGALTERLLASPAASLLAVELDRDLVAGLRQRFGADPRFQLLEGDVLALPLEPAAGPAPEKVVANIPYNITGPLLERLLGRLDRPLEHPYRALVLLVQQEVGERIRASPGSSAYSALSVRLQLLARCRGVCTVPPRCFAPPPKVHSEVIRLDPLPAELRPEPALARATEGLLRRCFAARRKMLRNTLAGLLPEERLEAVATAAGVALSQRPQELAPQRWLALAAGLQEAGLQKTGLQEAGLQKDGLQAGGHQEPSQERDGGLP
jgi:16S rRNA (adenine1518-N6/adenine1519-N6)-dimethyltransferase